MSSVPSSPQKTSPSSSSQIPPPKKLKEVVIHRAQGELVGLTLVVPIKVNELEISAVIDTAAEVTILSRTVFEKLKRKPCIVEEINLKGLNEDEPVRGQLINANLTIGSKTYKWDVYATETSDQCLLGLDFLYHHGVDIKLSTHSIKIAGEEIFASLVKISGASIKVSQVTLDKCTVVPPNSIKFVKGTSQHNLSGKVILQPVNKHTHVLMPHVAVAIQDREVPVQLTNPTDSFVTLRKGYDIEYLEEVVEIFEDPDEAIVDEKSADSSSEKDTTKLLAGE